MAELGERFSLDLPHPLATHPELLADLVEAAGLSAAKAEAKAKDRLLPPGELRKLVLDLVAQEPLLDHVLGRRSVSIDHQLAERRVFFVADRAVQRGGLPHGLQNLAD